MFPDLIDLGVRELPVFGETHLFLPTYGVLFAVAVVTAWLWFTKRARSLQVREETLFNLTFYTLLAGILGAKLLLVALDFRFYWNNPGEWLGVLRSGGVLLGGVVAGVATFIGYAHWKGLSVWRLLDAMAAPLILAQGIGRLACFSAGCCWGAATSGPLSVVYTHPLSSARTGVPLHTPMIPIQLYEMSIDLILAFVLTRLWRKHPEPAGTVWWWYVALYGSARFVLEFFRGDTHRGLWFGDQLGAWQISTSQIISVIAVGVAIALLTRIRSRSQTAVAS